MPADIAKVTELDFETIKKNLIDYFKRPGSPYRDWDFQGSGLNYLADILAYNTHYNAVNAHFSMNESFLDSCQIRANAVSRAKLISYTPRSRRGPRAKVNLKFTRQVESEAETLTLQRGTTFSTTLSGESYIFSTREDHEAPYNLNTGLFEFNDITIVQGKLQTRNYLVNDATINQKFTIDDYDIDISTLEVSVRSHQQATNSKTFLNGDLFTSYDSESKVYFLTETNNGQYQIAFGDGIIGKKLDNLNIVQISFLSSAGELPNGAKNFNFITTPNYGSFSLIAGTSKLETTESSYGGDERESIESIRQVAPKAFIAQNRVVTTNDYEALLKKNIPSIEALSVWGGQDNDPPVYGKVFISAKPKDAFFLTDAQKNEILAYLNKVKIITVKPELVDPNYVYLYFSVFFKYNPTLTTLSRTQLESTVRSEIQKYNIDSLGGFDKIFRYSKFLNVIDTTDNSILNSFARINVYKEFNLYANRTLPQTLDFKMSFFGDIDQEESYISSTSWRYNNEDVYLGDEYNANATNERTVYVFARNANGTEKKVFPNIGKLNVETGKLSLEAVPTTFDAVIQVNAIPDSYDIATVRNQLINIDLDRTRITGDIDDTFNSGAADRLYDPVSRF